MATVTSAVGTTVIAAVSALLVVSFSPARVVGIDAVLVMVPAGAVPSTVKVNVAVAVSVSPRSIAGKETVEPDSVAAEPDSVPETKVSPAGTSSERMMSAASDGPSLVSVTL